VELATRLDELAATQRQLATVSAAPALPDITALSLQCEAERTRAANPTDHEVWDRVAEAWQQLHRPFAAAYARYRAAQAAARAGKMAVAHVAARAAYRGASELRARPLCGELADLGRRARFDVSQAKSERAEPAGPFGLTPRELDVLKLLCAGHTNSEIAERLFVVVKTVDQHVSRILTKLGVANRRQAAAKARQLGLVGDVPGG
jgi:DNA-binding CsgD family transcriptional regulator